MSSTSEPKTPLDQLAVALMAATEKEWAWLNTLAGVPDDYQHGLTGEALTGPSVQARDEYMKTLVSLHFAVKLWVLSLGQPRTTEPETGEGGPEIQGESGPEGDEDE